MMKALSLAYNHDMQEDKKPLFDTVSILEKYFFHLKKPPSLKVVMALRKVILVVGQNKIVENLRDAFQRIKRVISPSHAKNRGINAPCVSKGECVDCHAKERMQYYGDFRRKTQKNRN